MPFNYGEDEEAVNGRVANPPRSFLLPQAESIQDITKEQMQTIKTTRAFPDAKILADLKKRKLVRMQKIITFTIQKGPKFALEIPEEATDLTAEMLTTGSWKTATFKPYNFEALGADQHAGALHPLNKVRSEFRQIFFEMGFEEMATDKYGFPRDLKFCRRWY